MATLKETSLVFPSEERMAMHWAQPTEKHLEQLKEYHLERLMGSLSETS